MLQAGYEGIVETRLGQRICRLHAARCTLEDASKQTCSVCATILEPFGRAKRRGEQTVRAGFRNFQRVDERPAEISRNYFHSFFFFHASLLFLKKYRRMNEFWWLSFRICYFFVQLVSFGDGEDTKERPLFVISHGDLHFLEILILDFFVARRYSRCDT